MHDLANDGLSMKTVDIHTHLLSPQVRFDRLYDRLAVRWFGTRLGLESARLKDDPYGAYVRALTGSIRDSCYVQRTCLFGVDSRLDRQGGEIDRDPTVCATTEDVLAVAGDHPDLFIPFLSVNPRRPDALERLDQYVTRGCLGAKFLQNYWALDLHDEAFIPYYERLAAHGIPLIIHIGSEYSITSESRYEHIDMLDLPLACGVTVIAAHMGLGRIEHKLRLWRNLSRDPHHFDRDYFTLLHRLQHEPNLYADISAILVPFRARALRHLSEQRQIHAKLLFGTDYPVPFPTLLNSHDLPWSLRRQIGTIKNPFDRYTETLLEYFPAGNPIYQNYRKLLPID
jgi:hypothetical protein